MNSKVVQLVSTSPKTLQPPAGLVTDNPAGSGQPPSFCLFTQDWLTLQTFIVQALQLPITIGDFETKYGSFQDQQSIQDCVAAMQSVKNLATSFGDPMTLITQLASDPAILQSDTAPAELYTHIVWFATRLYDAATTYNQTLGQFLELLNPSVCGTKEQCSQVLVEVLTGHGGLQSTAQQMVGLANDLVQALAAFNLKLAPSVTTMTNYTASSSKFYKDVEADITTDQTDEQTYQDEANTAYKLWRDLTISAVTTSVGTLVLSGGLAWPLSAALAGGLGDAAKKARDAYDDACDKLNAAKADEQKKILLKMDLNGFNIQMQPVSAAATAFQGKLQEVTGIWSTISNNIAYIANNFTPEQLGDLGWVQQALTLDRATKDWKIIADKAQEYTSQSLVTYQIHPFGTPLPAAKAA
jgi:hypothetical protein